ncbi:MAG: hypothetical protein HQK79_04525 [Desulfobacterales bacterium]|nr:hypothetical protein [Desulfobacterales bacterium]MBF0396184.1 hypothetical protein [Desulfobacterales bacterium]
MTTISHLNMIVQQGGMIREIPSDKHQPHDPTKMAISQMLHEKNKVQQTTVQESEETEKARLNEREAAKKQMQNKQEKKKHPEEKKERSPDEPKRLLDTVA